MSNEIDKQKLLEWLQIESKRELNDGRDGQRIAGNQTKYITSVIKSGDFDIKN